MEISKNDFSEIVCRSREKNLKTRRLTGIITVILQLTGLIFIVGAAVIIFSLTTGVIICAASAVLFVSLYYLEINRENKNQLEQYHMILTKSSYAAISKYCSDGCTAEAAEQLESVLSIETDLRRKAILGDILSDLKAMNGKHNDTFSVSEELFGEDIFFEILSCFNSLRSNILSKDNSSRSCTISSAYERITEILEDNAELCGNLMAAAKIIDTEILMSYYKEDYFRCIEYIDTRLICTNVFFDESSENNTYFSPAVCGYTLLKIQCLYYIGKYDEARKLCDDIMTRTVKYNYLREQSERLWELLN